MKKTILYAILAYFYFGGFSNNICHSLCLMEEPVCLFTFLPEVDTVVKKITSEEVNSFTGKPKTVREKIQLTTSTTIDIHKRKLGINGDSVSSNDKSTISSSASSLTCSIGTTDIGGTVFEDFNYNGVCDAGEYVGIKDITVNLADEFGNTFTTTTDSNGAYLISNLVSGRTYRVYFTNIPSWASPTSNGNDSGTTVQFVTAGNCVNLGVANPSDYCEENPQLGISCFINGSGIGNTRDGFVTFGYDAYSTGDNSGIPNMFLDGTNVEDPSKDAEVQEIGAVWGGDWQPHTKRVFLSAFSKRHVAFGPRGADGIYVMDYSGTTPTVAGGFDLQGITTTNGGTIDVGTIQRTYVTGSISNDDELSDTPSTPNVDLFAFDAVGKTSFGDLEFEEDMETLWVVNLKQNGLIRVDVSNYTPSTSNPSTLSSGVVDQYLLSSMPNMPTCNNGNLRPWGLQFYKGRAYLGLICDASISQNGADLNAFVISFDPANPYGGVDVELTFNMDYTREKTDNTILDCFWGPWISDWSQVEDSNGRQQPQPIISNIDFTDNGDMVIGVMDRFGNQIGVENYIPVSGSRTLSYLVVFGSGDILHACADGGSGWLLEGAGACPVSDIGVANSLSNDGPSGMGEYYFNDYFDRAQPSPDGTYNHGEISTGAVLVVKGTNTVINTVYDPLSDNRLFREGTFTQGLHYYNTTTAAKTGAYMLVDRTDEIEVEEFSKANGLGELLSMCNPAPIQIGNYVWKDSNEDGLQDAGESGIPAITVELYKGASLLATTLTNNVGQYYFSDKNATDPNLNWVGTNADTALLANTSYIIRISNASGNSQQAPLEGFELTLLNVNSNNNDDLDNDATLNGTNAQITAMTGSYGFVNHSFDFGFNPCVADAGDLATTPNITDFDICEGDDLLNGALVSVAFIANYSATDENEPNATYYNYQYLLANSSGTIIQSGVSGDFDFSILNSGTYNVYGLSYSTNNSPNTVTSYLNSITGDGDTNDINQIETEEANGVYCLDIDGLNAGGNPIQVMINPLPTLVVSNTSCAFNFQTYSIDVTSNANNLNATAGTVTNNNDGTFEVSGIPANTNVTLTGIFNGTACEREQIVNAPSCTCPTIAPPANPNNPAICDGSTTPMLTVTVGAGETVDWYSTSSGGTALATGTTAYTPSGSFGVGMTTYYAEARNIVSTCTSSTRTVVNLTVNANPTAEPSANEPCTNEMLNILANAASGDGSYSYAWTGVNGFSSNQANPTINNATHASSGVYYLTVTDGNLCEVEEQVNVFIKKDVCRPVTITVKRTIED